MIQAVLFDVDGTLLDTTEYIYQAFEQSLKHHGHPLLTREDMQKMMGKSLEDCYKEFCSLDDVLHLMEEHHAFQLANPDLVQPFPHVEETLEQLRSNGISLAAVTTRSRDTAIETLQSVDLFPLIDYFVGLEDVSIPKPDPEGIQKALNYFSVRADQAIMVGDSPVDIEAGRNAGTNTIGVTYGFHGEHIIESDPLWVIDDIAEVVEIVKSS